WVADRDWTVRRRVSVTDTGYDLVLSQLDTVAQVTVNGVEVLSAQNAFRRYRVDLSGALRAGDNEIAITFRSPTAAANAAQDAQPFFIPYTKNYPVPNGNMLRKPQCDFGWDWNAALMPMGLYGDLRLEPQVALRIRDVLVHQAHQPGRVDVTVTALLSGAATGREVVASVCGVTSTGTIEGDRAVFVLSIPDPDLWWPAGQGAQPLHDLTVTVDDAVATRRIGLRDMALVSEPDKIGRSFLFRVNGRDVFAKGANWIPADALPSAVTPKGVRDLLQSAVDANMNMIRVWGGGWYESDWFYQCCDELGLMVWQDAMVACSLYPADDDFLAEVDAEVRDNAARLQHHASLALWCGDNELIGALTWYEESLKDRDRFLVMYDRLNRTIEQALKAVDPQVNWWPSSPSPGPLSFGDAWHDDSSGDMHFWSVWHEGRDFDHYRDVAPRFCSEFGFQSYPSMDVIRRFAAPEDFNIAAPVMESHQKNDGGNARIAETMFRYFRFPVTFEDFVYVSQVQQGLAIKTAVTQWRSLMPHCMGTLIWQLNDTWPVCSWASLDHGGGWKLLHHMAADFYQPHLVTAVPGPDGVTLKAVSDGPEAYDSRIEVLALSMDGTLRRLDEKTVSMTPGTVQDVLTTSVGDHQMIYWRWTLPDGSTASDHFAPKPYKAYDLQPSGTHLQVDGNSITLTSQTAAFFASVEADCPGRFSDNAVLVLRDHPVTITFTPDTPSDRASFRVRDLHSATYDDPQQAPS
ncbi:MAG: glycoside hydrolase family 2 protein, partial [Pseudomonadota bacterium]